MATCILVGNELATKEVADLLTPLGHVVACCGEEEVVSRVGFRKGGASPVSHVIFYTTNNFREMKILETLSRLRSDFPNLAILSFRNGEGVFPKEEDFSPSETLLINVNPQVGAGKVAYRIHKLIEGKGERGSAGQNEVPTCLVIGSSKFVGNLVGELKHSRVLSFQAAPTDEGEVQKLVQFKENYKAPFGFAIQLSHFSSNWDKALQILQREFPNVPIFAFWVGLPSISGTPNPAVIREGGADAALVGVGPFGQAIQLFFEEKFRAYESSSATRLPKHASPTPPSTPVAPAPKSSPTVPKEPVQRMAKVGDESPELKELLAGIGAEVHSINTTLTRVLNAFEAMTGELTAINRKIPSNIALEEVFAALFARMETAVLRPQDGILPKGEHERYPNPAATPPGPEKPPKEAKSPKARAAKEARVRKTREGELVSMTVAGHSLKLTPETKELLEAIKVLANGSSTSMVAVGQQLGINHNQAKNRLRRARSELEDRVRGLSDIIVSVRRNGTRLDPSLAPKVR